MVHHLTFNVDGGCRHQGTTSAFGAAAAVLSSPFIPGILPRTCRLPAVEPNDPSSRPRPTSSRAELMAIILALKWALECAHDHMLSHGQYNNMQVLVRSDSTYAVNCIKLWRNTWERNGWRTSNGSAVVNQQLIRDAYALHDQVKQLGELDYEIVPRGENQVADRCCGNILDRMEAEASMAVDYFYSSAY